MVWSLWQIKTSFLNNWPVCFTQNALLRNIIKHIVLWREMETRFIIVFQKQLFCSTWSGSPPCGRRHVEILTWWGGQKVHPNKTRKQNNVTIKQKYSLQMFFFFLLHGHKTLILFHKFHFNVMFWIYVLPPESSVYISFSTRGASR